MEEIDGIFSGFKPGKQVYHHLKKESYSWLTNSNDKISEQIYCEPTVIKRADLDMHKFASLIDLSVFELNYSYHAS